MLVAIKARDAWLHLQIGNARSVHLWVEDPGGAGTDYAGVINAAQTALLSDTRTGVQRVIILLSDGDATADGPNACKNGIVNAESAEQPQADGTSTWIIAIAYDAPTSSSSSCTTDQPVSRTNPSGVAVSGDCAMQLIANNSVTEPSLYGGASYATLVSDCLNGTLQNATNRFYDETSAADLPTVFRQVGTTLTSPRLVSNGAT